MIEAELKSVTANDFDITTQNLDGNEGFGFWIEMEIGPKGQSKMDLFQLFICNPKWIANTSNKENFFWSFATLIISEFNYSKFIIDLRNAISQINGENWDQVILKLRLLARWEFEDYQVKI